MKYIETEFCSCLVLVWCMSNCSSYISKEMRTVSPALTYVCYFPLVSLYRQWYDYCQNLKTISSLQTIQRLWGVSIFLNLPKKKWSKFMKVMHWLLFNTLTAMQDTRVCINHLLLWWSSESVTEHSPCCLTATVVTSISCRHFTLLPLRTLVSAEHLPCCCGGHQYLLQTLYLATTKDTGVCRTFALLLQWSPVFPADPLPCYHWGHWCLQNICLAAVVTSISCRPVTLLPLRTLVSAEHLPYCYNGHQYLLQTLYLAATEDTGVCRTFPLLLWWSPVSPADPLPCYHWGHWCLQNICLAAVVVTSISCRPFTYLPWRLPVAAPYCLDIFSCHHHSSAGFMLALMVKIWVFWVVAPHRFMGRYQSFGRTCCLHLQGWKWRQYDPPKHQYLPTELHDVKTHKTTPCQALP
jgi:hypothetical protein